MLSINALQKQLKNYIIGQDQIIDRLAIDLYKYLIRCHGRDYGYTFVSPMCLLFIGNTGVGKTYTINKFVEFCGLPCVTLNAKTIVQEGWSGTSFLEQLVNQNYTNTGLVVIDEFDKIIEPLGTDSSDNINRHIQMSLLKYLEGSEVLRYYCNNSKKEIPRLEFKNTIFILSGAFSSLFKSFDKREVGFILNKKTNEMQINQKLIEFGMLPEILGRIQQFYFFNDMTEDYYAQLLASENFVLNAYRFLLKKLDIILEIDQKKLIKEALAAKLGARGLIQAVEKIVSEALLNEVHKVDLDKFSPLYCPINKT